MNLIAPLNVWSPRAGGGGCWGPSDKSGGPLHCQKYFETNAWPQVGPPFLMALACGIASGPDQTLVKLFTETSRSSEMNFVPL